MRRCQAPALPEAAYDRAEGGLSGTYVRRQINGRRVHPLQHRLRASVGVRAGVAARDASEHYEGYELSRCSDDPTQHVVRIEWDSEEGHLSGFPS